MSPGYFQTMEIPVLKGRQIEQSDSEHAPGVVVINQTMARQYFRNENPIGKRIVIAQNLGPDFADEPREIIGVVGDAKADELNAPRHRRCTRLSPRFLRIWPRCWSGRFRSAGLFAPNQIPAAPTRSSPMPCCKLTQSSQ